MESTVVDIHPSAEAFEVVDWAAVHGRREKRRHRELGKVWGDVLVCKAAVVRASQPTVCNQALSEVTSSINLTHLLMNTRNEPGYQTFRFPVTRVGQWASALADPLTALDSQSYSVRAMSV